jgi:hypothetical protein
MRNPYKMPKKEKCSKCKDKGNVFEKGITHTCWDCLKAGRL